MHLFTVHNVKSTVLKYVHLKKELVTDLWRQLSRHCAEGTNSGQLQTQFELSLKKKEVTHASIVKITAGE